MAAISAVVLFAGPAFVGYVPKYILGGLLFFLGGGLVYQWLIQSSRQLLRLEYLSLIAIALLIINSGFIAGVLIGVVIGCATFALSASRVNAIKFSFDGSEYRSSLDRGPHEQSLLADAWPGDPGHGVAELFVLRLGQSALPARQSTAGAAAGLSLPDFRFPSRHRHRFLGDAKLCANQASDDRSRRPDCSRQAHAGTGASVSHRRIYFRRHHRCVRPRSGARSPASKAIIEAHRARGRPTPRSLRAWLSEALGDAQLAERLAEYCRRLEVSEPATLSPGKAKPPTSMHFILEGRVGIIVDLPRGPHHARAQPGPAHHGRRNGPDYPEAAQRDNSGRGAQACFTSSMPTLSNASNASSRR